MWTYYFSSWELLVPLDQVGISDAVLWDPWGLTDRAEIEFVAFGHSAESALKARCLARDDDSALASEALRAPVNQNFNCFRFDRAIVVVLSERINETVEPSSCLYVVKPGDDDLELAVKLHILLLNLANVVGDVHASDSLRHKFRSYFRFEFSHIFLPEKELAVEICDINTV